MSSGVNILDKDAFSILLLKFLALLLEILVPTSNGKADSTWISSDVAFRATTLIRSGLGGLIIGLITR